MNLEYFRSKTNLIRNPQLLLYKIKLIQKVKKKRKTETNSINKVLNKALDSDSAETSIYDDPVIIETLGCVYQAIEYTSENLSLNTNLYNKYSNELKNNNLDNDEKNKIQDEVANAKQNILDLTSPKYISSMDKFISGVNTALKNYCLSQNKGINFSKDLTDKNSLLIPSMESLGFKSDENMTFEQVLDEIPNIEKTFDEKLSKFNAVANKYELDVDDNEDIPNKGLAKTLNTYA